MTHPVPQNPAPEQGLVLAFLCDRIAFYTQTDAAGISAGDDPLDYGLSSLDTARLCGEIEAEFGAPLDPATFFESTSIGEIARHVILLPREAANDSG